MIRDSIGGSAFDIASQRLQGKRNFRSTGPAKMLVGRRKIFAGRMFVTLAYTVSYLSDTDAESDIGCFFSSTGIGGMEVPTDNEGPLPFILEPE